MLSLSDMYIFPHSTKQLSDASLRVLLIQLNLQFWCFLPEIFREISEGKGLSPTRLSVFPTSDASYKSSLGQPKALTLLLYKYSNKTLIQSD